MTITANDLIFIQDLSNRNYVGQSIRNDDVASEAERRELLRIKHELEEIAEHFNHLYGAEYGPFQISKNRNALTRQGRMRHVWSGIYKGASRKQFSAQISFVISVEEPCLDVGFYFGIGNVPDITPDERIALQQRIRRLGEILRSQIQENESLNIKFYEAFEFGFKAYDNVRNITSDEWLLKIAENPAMSKIIFKLYPKNNVISIDAIGHCVDMVISLMDAIPSDGIDALPTRRKTKPLTAEERALQAKRLKEIGDKGEEFALSWEKDRLDAMKNPFKPVHRAKMSDSYHFDIESREGDIPIYIEVKTTVLRKDDVLSNRFYISSDEYSFYTNNPETYRLYRVYDIEGTTPVLIIVDMEKVQVSAKNYYAIINK